MKGTAMEIKSNSKYTRLFSCHPCHQIFFFIDIILVEKIDVYLSYLIGYTFYFMIII